MLSSGEYLAIAKLPDDDLLQTVCDEMPPFPERESALLSRLTKAQGHTGDKRTWVIGGKAANKEKEAGRANGASRRPKSGIGLPATGQAGEKNGSIEAQEQVTSGLAGLDIGASHDTSLSAPSTSVFTHGTEVHLARLSYSSEGVLYEDAQLQIGLKSEYNGNRGRLALYFGNKITAPFESVTLVIEGNEPGLTVTLAQMPTNTIEPMTQIEQVVTLECLEPFTGIPVLKVSYLAGSLQTFAIRLPVFLTKFIEPVELNGQAFFERWRLIGGPPREAQEIFKIKLDASKQKILEGTKMRKILSGFKLKILEGVDPNPLNVVGAGVLNMAKAGKVGCLFRLEPNQDAKVCVV